MHRRDAATDALADAVLRYSLERTRLDPPPLDHPVPAERLRAEAGATVTPAGLGGAEALRVFASVLAPACISIDHPRFLSFVPAAPTEAAVLFDLVVGASSIYAGSWMEGAGAVFAENEALRWLADLAGFPASAGGVFLSGGTAANLSALVAARDHWRRSHPEHARERGFVIAGAGAHSSVAATARVIDADIIGVGSDDVGRLTGEGLQRVLDSGLDPADRARLFAVVATAGTTNAGVVDDLAGVAEVAAANGLWLHVDGAYGLAALCAPSVRGRFDGIERADSFVVDPHKWLFAPFDCAALLYRDPQIARIAHIQAAEYLQVLAMGPDWNPSDYAFHLSRRARGLPFWFSLATHGTDAYRAAIETTLGVAREGADLIRSTPHVELVVEPGLSVLVFRRLGWGPDDYQAWSERMLYTGVAFVMPTSWQDETVLRFCIVNPRTTVDDLRVIVDSLR